MFSVALVVEIHTRPLEAFAIPESVIEGIDVIAVPFFFIASAFLCFRGLSEEDFAASSSYGSIRVRKTAFKLLELYLIWTVLYLPVTVFGNLLYGNGLLHGLLAFARGTLLVGQNFCSWPLWYLLAGTVAFSLVYFCLRGGVASKTMVGAAFLLLLLGYFVMCAADRGEVPDVIAVPARLYEKLFLTTRNGLFEGFFYVAVGAVFGMRHKRLESMSAFCLVVGFVSGVAGCVLVNPDAHLPFCALAGICLFLLSVRRHGASLSPHIGARNASTIIYLTHMIFAVLFVYVICGGTDPDIHANDANRGLLYLFSLGGSALFAVAIIPAAKRLPFLKRIFGI